MLGGIATRTTKSTQAEKRYSQNMDKDEQLVAEKIEALIGDKPLREPDEPPTLFRRARWITRVVIELAHTDGWSKTITVELEESKRGKRTVTVTDDNIITSIDVFEDQVVREAVNNLLR